MRALLVLALASSAFADPRIDTVMKPWTGTSTPGCAIGVIQQGKLTHAKGYGMADLERGIPIKPTTLFDIGSTSKQFTAATVLMLAAEGKLELDKDIRTYLPELPALTKRPVTIRHLLHHLGGLRDYESMLVARGKRIEDFTTAREALDALARQRGVEREPGIKFAYSNTGFFLLAQIVEHVTKQPFREQVTARIFTPLGMTATQIFDDHRRIIAGRALGYAPGEKTGWRFDTSQWEQTGDGSVITSVVDLAKWDAHFYAPKIGGGKALVEAQLERGKLADGKPVEYAAGLFHGTYRGLPQISHSGGWAGYRAEFIRFPAQQTSVIVLCNAASANPTRIAFDIVDVVLAKQLAPKPAAPPPPPPPVTLSTSELDVWVGKYRDPSTGDVMTIRRDGANLVVDDNPLVPTSKTVFRVGPSPFRLELGGTAPKRTMGLRGPAQQDFVEVAPYKPTAAELAALAGRYWSPELAVMWTIRIENGAAVIDTPTATGTALEMIAKDEVVARGLRFKLGAKRLTASVENLSDIVFERL